MSKAKTFYCEVCEAPLGGIEEDGKAWMNDGIDHAKDRLRHCNHYGLTPHPEELIKDDPETQEEIRRADYHWSDGTRIVIAERIR